MNYKKQTTFLLLFLLTGFFNKSFAYTTTYLSDSTSTQNILFDDEIMQLAQDSLKFNIEEQKVFLYGNAKIQYQNITISASYIEIDRKQNTIYAMLIHLYPVLQH